jgi:uncharacterized protein (DUF488 family)
VEAAGGSRRQQTRISSTVEVLDSQARVPRGGRRQEAGSGFRAYADHLRSTEFARGLSDVEDLAGGERATLMCTEGMWWRYPPRLIADVLALRGWRVLHLLPDGRQQEHSLTEFAMTADDGLPIYPAPQAQLWSVPRQSR